MLVEIFIVWKYVVFKKAPKKLSKKALKKTFKQRPDLSD